jgi:hypothetical protein
VEPAQVDDIVNLTGDIVNLTGLLETKGMSVSSGK